MEYQGTAESDWWTRVGEGGASGLDEGGKEPEDHQEASGEPSLDQADLSHWTRERERGVKVPPSVRLSLAYACSFAFCIMLSCSCMLD